MRYQMKIGLEQLILQQIIIWWQQVQNSHTRTYVQWLFKLLMDELVMRLIMYWWMVGCLKYCECKML